MSNYKIYDADDNFIGEIIEDAKDSVSDTITGGDVNWAAILGLIALFVFLWVLSKIWAALWIVIKFICRLLWWLVKFVAFMVWWLAKETLYALWWLVRLPFSAIFYKEVPEWWFPDWFFPEW